MNSKFFLFLLVSLFSIFGLHSYVQAQTTYPIPELGNCRDANECYLYCEIPQNTPACWSYEKYVLHAQVLAESDEDMAKKYGITFPIAELGNCASIDQCHTYCENPSNQQACIDFAKKKGFYEEVRGPTQDELLARAGSELGCTSIASCQAYCEQHQAQCEEFAQRHGLTYEQADRRAQELLEKAKSELGCTSISSCEAYCNTNQQQCMEFMKKYGLYYETHQEGFYGPDGKKLPCDSEQSCRQYCEANPTECGASAPACEGDESCRKYCQEHPDQCPGYSPTSGGTGVYQEGNYLGPGGCTTDAECQAYCQAHPSQCPGFDQSQTSPQPTYQYQEPTYYPQPTYYEQPQSYPTYQPEPTSYQQPQSYPTYEPQPTP